MKNFCFYSSILCFCFLGGLASCCKDKDSQIQYSVTDDSGNFIGTTPRQGYFTRYVENRNEAMDSFYMQTIGFIPDKLGCSDTANVVMYPNPIDRNAIPKLKIQSTSKIVKYFVWPNDGSSMSGYAPIAPSFMVLSEHEDLIPITISMKYNFMILTEDSCVYFADWNLIRR